MERVPVSAASVTSSVLFAVLSTSPLGLIRRQQMSLSPTGASLAHPSRRARAHATRRIPPSPPLGAVRLGSSRFARRSAAGEEAAVRRRRKRRARARSAHCCRVCLLSALCAAS
eukprot:351088-Chlamydomonas_euryale.AAC.1